MPMLRRTGVLVLTATLVAAGGASAAQAQSSQTSGKNKSIARPLVAARGWNLAQFGCLVSLWHRESGWNHRAGNRSSGAYGIPQALPGHKMASAGSDWRTNPRTQIKWGLSYIKQRYSSPCRAWGHFQSHGWY
ncbi:transglycosylase SLT domain-containing protein [Nonomuraea fuscirosea]|nr:transglycosylase SLT domain-containing protein [Nonomuraea fuscirosea]